MRYENIVKERLIAGLASLTRGKKLALMVAVAFFFSFLLGPFWLFWASSGALKGLAIKNGELVAKNLAAQNAGALVLGSDLLFNEGESSKMPGVLSFYLTDPSGLIVYPPERSREDARKDPLLLESLKTFSPVSVFKHGILELAEPSFYGERLVGAARVSYSTRGALPQSLIFALFRGLFISAVAGSLLSLGIFKTIDEGDKHENAPLRESPVKEKNFDRVDAASFADNMTLPLVLFDAGFKVTFANGRARDIHPRVMESHISDLLEDAVLAAEEIEMLQSDSAVKGRVRLWRINESGITSGYGMTYEEAVK